jgi:hypothetical protein
MASKPFASCLIDAGELSRRILDADRHQAIYSAVALYEEAMRKYLREEEARPQLWFAIVPDEVYKYGRPKSTVPVKLRTPGTRKLGMKAARSILSKGSMFPEEMEAAAVYEYELNFHNHLKARLMDTGQVIRVAKEVTLDPPTEKAKAKARMQDPATIAWNLSTTSFYKIGGRPWRLAELRDGVCYVGLVFKRIERPSGRDNACCGAQMFLGSGDGLVFRGAVGPWYSEKNDAFHLDQVQAAKLMEMIVRAYKDNHGAPPTGALHSRQDELRRQRMDRLRQRRAAIDQARRRSDPRQRGHQGLPLRRQCRAARDRGRDVRDVRLSLDKGLHSAPAYLPWTGGAESADRGDKAGLR